VQSIGSLAFDIVYTYYNFSKFRPKYLYLNIILCVGNCLKLCYAFILGAKQLNLHVIILRVLYMLAQLTYMNVQLTSCVRTVDITWTYSQGRPLGGASGALAPGADFEGAPKRRSPTGHTLIRSSVALWFPHLQTIRVAKDFFKFCCTGFSLFWCVLVFTYV
jgi:hypothetical protein